MAAINGKRWSIGSIAGHPRSRLVNRAWIRLKSIVAKATIRIMKIRVGNLPGRSFVCNSDTDTWSISPPPQFRSNVRSTAHGPFFARVRYIPRTQNLYSLRGFSLSRAVSSYWSACLKKPGPWLVSVTGITVQSNINDFDIVAISVGWSVLSRY
jgi:hypothetical protein